MQMNPETKFLQIDGALVALGWTWTAIISAGCAIILLAILAGRLAKIFLKWMTGNWFRD